jgi:hypothetical protein
MGSLTACAPEATTPLPPLFDRATVAAFPTGKSDDTSLRKISLSVPVPGIAREVYVKIASTEEEWKQAYRLVATNYQARGYEPRSSKPFRFTPFHALPDTTTFVAKHEGQVIATLSLVQDNTLLGLPMESIFGAEVEELRDAGKHLVEVTSLADRDLSLREFVPVFGTLMRMQAQFGILQDADTWVISVNPRHRSFYQKVLGFVPIGPERAYPAVQNHPAVPYLLNIGLLETNAPKMYAQFFEEWLPQVMFKPRAIPARLMRFFAENSSQTDWDTVDRISRFLQRCGSPRAWL